MSKMNALVKKYAEPGLWLEQVEIPKIKDNEVLVKIRKTAICGTDIHIYTWDKWSQNTIKTPMTIGHEYVGEIVELGKLVDGYKVGDLVTGEGHIVCGKCRNCRGGHQHLCKHTVGIGVNRDGIFAEYAAIPASNLFKCSKDVPEELYSIFDPFGNATHTALSFNMVGEDVLITGAGPIGIMAVAISKHVGARNVVITDINEYRLDLARKMGATRAVNTKNTDLKAVMNELNMVEGFDVGLEMSGNGMAFNQMIDSMVNGGKIALLGIQSADTQVNWDKIIFGGLFLKGIYGREMYETWYKMNAMVQSGLDITPIITHRFDYKDFKEGFEIMKSGQSGKIILNWDK